MDGDTESRAGFFPRTFRVLGDNEGFGVGFDWFIVPEKNSLVNVAKAI